MTLKKKKELSDPLAETSIPEIFVKLNLNHFSPTQSSYADGPWVYRYVICTQEQRRQFDGNANMHSGVACNNAIQYHYANKIFKLNPNTKKLSPVVNNKLSLDLAIQKVQEEFDKYLPVDDKDIEKFERYRETVPQTILQLEKACETLGVSRSKNIVAENILSFNDDRLHLPIIGRSDLEFSLEDFSSVAPSIVSSSGNPFCLLEIKTSWDRLGKVKVDGYRSWLNAKTPLTPNRQHLIQCAFYKKCKPDHDVKLIYVVKDDFKIFDERNCADLEPENLNNYYEELVRTLVRRERLIMKYASDDDVTKIKSELVKDVDPNFDHAFHWKIGHQWLQHAKDLWKQQ